MSDFDHLKLLREIRQEQLNTLQHTLEGKMTEWRGKSDAEIEKLSFAVDVLAKERQDSKDKETSERSNVDTQIEKLRSIINQTEQNLNEVQANIATEIQKLQIDIAKVSSRLQTVEESASEVERQSKVDGEELADETRLQKHLHHRYQDDETSKVSILPSYRDVPLSKIFAPIAIREDLENVNEEEGNSELNVWQDRVAAQSSGEPDETIESYFDIFYKENALQKNIYMLGQAGSGKTTFCNHLVDVWCHSSCTYHYKEPEVIRRFDFVFLVACRNAEKSETILDMIFNQLFASDSEYLQPTVRQVLKTKPEKCLILIDGLDEWAGSPSKATGPMTPRGLPNRKGLENCVVLTTSRPWRIEALRQGLGKHQRILEFQGLTNNDMETLSKNLFSALKVSDESVAIKAFLGDVEVAKMTEMVRSPLMLIIALTTWHQAKRKLDSSVCVNFTGMLESLIQRAEGESGRSDDTDRLADISQLPKLKQDWNKQNRQLPSCFINMNYCEQYSPLIYKLANFAFDTLFHEMKEKSLVFSIEALEHIFKKSELDVCLKTGIFSLASAPVRSVKRMANVSFLHKSLQEYLAALWLASDNFSDCLAVFKAYCKCVKDVLDVGHVVLFVAGLSSDKGEKLWTCIREVAMADPVVHEHRQAVATVYRAVRYEHPVTQTVIRLHKLSLDCSTEASHIQSGQPDIYLNHYMIPDVYVGHEMSVDQCGLVYDQVLANCSGVKSLIVNRTELAPRLVQNLQKLVSMERLHIELPCGPSLQQCSRLCSVISNLTCLRSLYMNNCWSETDSCCQMSLKLPQLRKLTLIGSSSIPTRLHLYLPVAMKTFDIWNIVLSHPSILSLASLLSSTSSLQELYISWLQCFDCDVCTYDVNLTSQSQLGRLELWDWDHGVQTLAVSPDMKQLREIGVYYVQMSPEAWMKLLLSLPKPAHKLTVKLCNVDIDADSVRYIERHFNLTCNETHGDCGRSINFHGGVPT